MGRCSRFLGPVVFGGAMLLGADGVSQPFDSRPQPSHKVDVLRSSGNAALIRILTGKDRATALGGRAADNRRHRAADIMMERLQQATQKELVDCLDVPFFTVRQRATELLLTRGLSEIEATKAPVDTTRFRREHEEQSHEQRRRLRWIADTLDYEGMQCVWNGSVFRSSEEEMRAVTSVADMLCALSKDTQNPVDIQYGVYNETVLSSLLRDVGHLRGRTFWNVFRDIYSEMGWCVSPITASRGRLCVSVVFSRPISSSDGALYGQVENHGSSFASVHFVLEPKLDLVRCAIKEAIMRRPDGRTSDISQAVREGGEMGKFRLYLPAAEHKGESVDIDIGCDVEALPVHMFVVDDPGTPTSMQVDTIVARYTGVSDRPDKYGRYTVALSIKRDGNYPDLKQFWQEMGCTAFSERGEPLSSGGVSWLGEKTPIVEWSFYGKPARIEFALPDPTLLRASKMLHFTGVPLPDQAQVR